MTDPHPTSDQPGRRFAMTAVSLGVIDGDVLQALEATLPPGADLAAALQERGFVSPAEAEWIEATLDAGMDDVTVLESEQTVVDADGPSAAELTAIEPGGPSGPGLPTVRPAEPLASGPTIRERPEPGRAPSTQPAPPAPAAPAIGPRLARYPVIGQLGAGGMGEVLLVRDDHVGREVAAKVIRGEADPLRLQKFTLEAKLTGQLQHPNIIPLHELGQSPDGRIFFTMKRVRGRELADLLSERGPQLDAGKSLTQLLQLFGKVCDAMAYAHARGVIHRDLKPANIMVGDYGEVLVMDWGLAKLVGTSEPDPEGQPLTVPPVSEALVTMQGAVAGTPTYMSPEQATGKIDKLDGRTDVYALGAILYQILTGVPPYEGRNARQVLKAVREGPPPPPSAHRKGLPRELEAVVLKAMDRRLSRRYQSVQAMQADLEAYLEGRTLATVQYNPLQRLLKWVGRNRGLVIGLAIGFGALLTAALSTYAWWATRPATLVVESDPAGVKVVLSGPEGRQQVASTPATFSVTAGRYHLQAAGEQGYETALPGVGDVALTRAERRTLKILPRAQQGRLALDVLPPGAQVRAVHAREGVRELTAPYRGQLTAGRWRLELQAPGYLSSTVEVDLPAGTEVARSVALRDRTLWWFESRSDVSVLAEDLDGDGRPEVIATSRHGWIHGLSAAGQRRWDIKPHDAGSFHTGNVQGPARAIDVDGDGRREIIALSQESAACLDGVNGRVWWRVPTRVGALREPRWAARTGSGPGLLVATAGGYSLISPSGTAIRNIVMLGSRHHDLPLAADLGGGAEVETVMPYRLSDRVVLLTRTLGLPGTPNQIQRRVEIPEPFDAELRTALADFDGDGRPEAIVVGGRQLHRVDGGETLRWSRPIAAGEVAIRVADLDGDGASELLVGGGRPLTLTCVAADGSVRWRRVSEGARAGAIELADLDEDGRPEVLWLTDGAVVALSADGRERWSRGRELPVDPVIVGIALAAELQDDPGRELLVALGPRELGCLSASGRVRWRWRGRGRVGRPAVADLDGDGRLDVLVCAGRRLEALVGNQSPLTTRRSVAYSRHPVRTAGPWAIACGERPVVAALDGRLHQLDETVLFAPTTLPDGRLVLPGTSGLWVWAPGQGAPEPLFEVAAPGALARAGELLIVGRLRGGLEAYTVAPPHRRRWQVALQGRVEVAPLPLDLSGDGRPDHVLAVTCAGEVALVDLAGEVRGRMRARGPIRHRPLVLGPASAGGVPVALTAGDTLLRLEVSARGLREVGRRVQDLTPTTPLAGVDVDRDGRVDLLLQGTYAFGLQAVTADLRHVVWAVPRRRGEHPSGPIQVVDLDGDGQPEIAVGWLVGGEAEGTRIDARSEIRVHRLDGTPLLELSAGRSAPQLVPVGDRLWALGDALRIWSRWPRPLTPRPSRELTWRAWGQLAAGAWREARRLSERLPGPERGLVRAIADWHQGRQDALLGLLGGRDGKAIRARVRRVARGFDSRGPSHARLLAALGERPRTRRLAVLEPLETSTSSGPLKATLSTWQPMVSGCVLRAGGVFRRGDVGSTGLLFVPYKQGRLEVAFALTRPYRQAELRLDHRSLPLDDRGNAQIQIRLDGRTIVPCWEVPWWDFSWGRQERFSLGALSAGQHTVEIRVLLESQTLYSLRGLQVSDDAGR